MTSIAPATEVWKGRPWQWTLMLDTSYDWSHSTFTVTSDVPLPGAIVVTPTLTGTAPKVVLSMTGAITATCDDTVHWYLAEDTVLADIFAEGDVEMKVLFSEQ